jgi:Asp-tRNA(Asn)/Glu-tRNA(Gln) amidotransferase A subunit family amidase
MPLAASTRDVIGPIARCVRDAALTLDGLAGFSPEDPKTVAGSGTSRKAATPPVSMPQRCEGNVLVSTDRAGESNRSRPKRPRCTSGRSANWKFAGRP